MNRPEFLRQLDGDEQIVLAARPQQSKAVVDRLAQVEVGDLVFAPAGEPEELAGVDISDQGERAYDFAGTAISILKGVK